MPLRGKIVLVTNVTRFAGRAATRMAQAQGASVVVTDESFAEAKARKAWQAEFAGSTALAESEPGPVAAAVMARHGRIDALVNNDAWPAQRAPLVEARLDDYRAAFETMAVRPFALTQSVVPHMRAGGRGGKVLFVSSAAPLRGIANYSMYVSARAATNGLVSSLAKELGRDGITVNALGSNYVENPDYFPPALLADKAAMSKMTAQIPLGRLGRPEEIAATICFLISDGAGFITGHVLPHAGGWA
ncbi:MAG: SDR family oxidoreductase [Rhodospirillales bacterium]|nr:SDR family oxidoreductase [Rhodospirillales bacterium]QQS11042.1 MAG: SDR family oxidoreductase [Rhodospirillales bacterium]